MLLLQILYADEMESTLRMSDHMSVKEIKNYIKKMRQKHGVEIRSVTVLSDEGNWNK